MSLSILLITDAWWTDHTGGISKSVFTEASALATRGHKVIVVTRRLHTGSPAYEQMGKLDLYRYHAPPRSSGGYRLYPLSTLKNLPALLRELCGKEQPDVAYVHDPFQAVALYRSKVGVPTIYVFHAPIEREIDIDVTAGKYGSLGLLWRPIKPWVTRLERSAVLGAGAILVRSNFMKRELITLYPAAQNSNIHTIPLAVDTDRFSFVSKPTLVRDELGLPQDRFILLTVRRLVKRMGLETLIDAISLVIRDHPETLLLIGGQGYLERVLQDQVNRLGLASYVRFLGFIPENRLPKYFQAADLFVLPSAQLEGFGLATIEALSCGTPAICTPIGANQEVVAGIDPALICSSCEARDIARTISDWMRRGVSEGIRRKCRDYCFSRFGVSSVVPMLEAVLTACTNHA